MKNSLFFNGKSSLAKKILFFPMIIFALIAALQTAQAQNGVLIAPGTGTADPSAMLEVSASNKGVLLPRVALISVTDPIAGTKPIGLLVWNTSTSGTYSVPGYYYWNGTDWKILGQPDNLGNHTATQNLDMANNKVVNVGNTQNPGDAVNTQTIQKGSLIFGATSGTNNYTLALSPAITSYTTGMVVNFIVSSASTGAVTLNVNTLGAKNVVKNGSLPLVANDIKVGQIVSVIYDGTNFQMISQTGNVSTGGGGGSIDPTQIYLSRGY